MSLSEDVAIYSQILINTGMSKYSSLTSGSPYISDVEAKRIRALTRFAKPIHSHCTCNDRGGLLPNMLIVPMVLLFIVFIGLYIYFTGEAGDAK